MLHRNIIKPMEKISDLTKQLARGYLGEINLQYKNRYFKDFIWGLDMLREQLSYERDMRFYCTPLSYLGHFHMLYIKKFHK